MAMIRAESLTLAEQAVIDKAILSILNIWPGLNYGEFPGRGVTAEYELRLMKFSPSMLRARKIEKAITQSFTSPDGKSHFEILGDAPDR